ncbi:7-cyano-7-deazaguanine/7-aminomethyl-7-deazaguanine transporter [Desulfopila inferna]|uniref:7-cyano-7-deazaguanine/7-aminomethyl-7- deazaguanine transporter n=1 Tax=Desulfopila inferna TaxID=468528 RepID=UPI0019623C29|nr:7-cyano-7-deazaguanine/7-aminomethyl-7-deazaguanine transporter [Desulfopila inferna]MBM9606285.1 7-cyano-7-deazaguanine/7-aminomethyl-7-deazaguanine transporter [Desulfopila inferna]
MLSLTAAQTRRALFFLIGFHILIIALSNYLVQLPLQIFGMHSTWGTFSFPFIFLATDLTVRVFGAVEARRIIFGAMLPALAVSYLFSVLFFEGIFQGMQGLTEVNFFVFRIALASFTAYVFGQLLDIKVFAGLRRSSKWWVAPSASTLLGNLLDTIIFFGVAFWASSDSFMAAHWPEIAALDYGFKITVSMLLFLPLYGVLLRYLTEKILIGNAERAIAG